MTKKSHFFDGSPKSQSRVKSTIVFDYFVTWSKIICGFLEKYQRDSKVSYVDLYAGRGRYMTGEESTPLLVMRYALKTPTLRKRFTAEFNDADKDYILALEKEIRALPEINSLAHLPVFHNYQVDDNVARRFEASTIPPTLFFIDPTGYKGISLRLINSVLRHFGCDLILFFNYNRISPGLENPMVEHHMNALFGDVEASTLRTRIAELHGLERESVIMNAIVEAIKRPTSKEKGQRYVREFRFLNDEGSRTSHYLVFASKHPKGYEVMEQIMARYSSAVVQGVPSFEFNPTGAAQLSLFDSEPLHELQRALMERFAGRTITMRQVYEEHQDRRFSLTNYKEALKRLEAESRIVVNPPADKRRRVKGEPTFSDDVLVTFPNKS